MANKPYLQEYIKRGAEIIYFATALLSAFGLILDSFKLLEISHRIVYFNAITFVTLVLSIILFFSKLISLKLSFIVIVYAIVANSYITFFFVSFRGFELYVLLRDSFFILYLIILSYFIADRLHGVILTLVHIFVFTFLTLNSDNPFMRDSLMLFIILFASFSAVTWFILYQLEKSVNESKLKQLVIEEQINRLNETNVQLEERQQQIEEQAEELLIQKSGLANANKELMELVATKDKFFSIIAHDLKNPLNALLGFSELLYTKHTEYSHEKKERLLEMIYKSSLNSYTLLDNLLTWSRMQTGGLRIKPENVKIDDLIKETAELHKSMLLQKNIKLNVLNSDGFIVFADRYMISTVLNNLLSNAIKFTPNGGEIEILYELANKEYLKVSVIDSGIGIEPEVIPVLFQIDRNYSTYGTNKEKGTGLGLLLCKEFVEKNNGKIHIESKVNHGTSIYFTIPLSDEDKQQ